MALMDLSVQDERHARTWASRAEELTKGAINLCLCYQTEVRGIVRHCKPSDLWGMVEVAQPELASDKEQMAPLSTHQGARSTGLLNC